MACLVLASTAVLGSRFSSRVDAVLGENWRGAYDILVTAPDQRFGGTTTDGLVDPNFVSTAGEGGISLDQLREVRAIDGVEVAAPVGMVGLVRTVGLSPALWIDRASLPGPMAVRLTMTATTPGVDGSAATPVVRNTGYATLSGAAPDPAASSAPALGEPISFSPTMVDAGGFLTLGQLPQFGATVVAVDPVAEAELRGGAGDALFDALITAPTDRELSGGDWSHRVDAERFTTAWGALSQAESSGGGSAVPLIVNEDSLPLEVTVQIDRASQPVSDTLWADGVADQQELRDLVGSAEFEPWETVVHRVGGVTAPFANPDLLALWPGATLDPDEGSVAFSEPATSLVPYAVGRPRYGAPTSDHDAPPGDRPAYEVVPRGEVGADGLPVDPERTQLYGADPSVGLTQAYRDLVQVSGTGFEGAVPAPLGTFTSDDLTETDSRSASYVPLGAAPVQARLLGTDGEPGTPISPNLSGVDFLTTEPGAFTDLAGGAALRGDTPIDAIRVRLTGITSYNDASQAEVARIAAQIERMGLRANVVAGSSPQPVAVYVPDYFPTDQTPDGGGSDSTRRDLGWVEQPWTTLGASVVVDEAMTDTRRALAMGTFLAVGLGLLVTGLMSARGWREEVVLLSRIGWRPGSIVRRLLVREAPGTVAIVAVSVACLLLTTGGDRPVFLTLPVLAVLVSIGSVLVALLPLLRRAARTARGRRAPKGNRSLVATPAGIARRHLLGSRMSSALAILGAATLTLVAATSTAAVMETFDAAGATRLANLGRNSVITLVAATALVGLGAATLLTMLGLRIERQQQRDRDATLARIGFTPTLRRQVARRENFLLTAGAISVSLVVAGVALAVTGSAWPPFVALVATLAASSVRFAPTTLRGAR